MSKQNKFLKESDFRVSPQAFPTVNKSSSYNVAGHDGIPSMKILEPVGQPVIDTKKVFDDEQIAYEASDLLPYTLDNINVSLVKAYEGLEEVAQQLKATYSHPSMNREQKNLIKEKFKLFTSMKKMILKFSKTVDSFKIGNK